MRTDQLSVLPVAARLARTFDPESLRTDVAMLSRTDWSSKNGFTAHQPDRAALSRAWKCLPLRSPGGDPARTDPGGPEVAAFAPTHWLTRAPYLTRVLDDIPGIMRSARLLTLAPGSTSPVHTDDVGLDRGLIRLHVPIVTNPQALVGLGSEVYNWQPGELWYGDFARPHFVENRGPDGRIHLVIDMLVTVELLDIFPVEFRNALPAADVMFARPTVPLRSFELADFECDIEVPCSDYVFEHARWGSYAESVKRHLATVRAHREDLVLSFPAGREYGLDHVGNGEFRINGWTDMHTIRIGRRVTPEAVLTYRRGGEWREVRCVAHRPGALAPAPGRSPHETQAVLG